MNPPAFDLTQTIALQHGASHPECSAWVRANAGSGKTHVLAQRVIRLLLAGTPPSKILCLTFTKAAAANMALRIFDTLASWTVLDDDALRQEIANNGAPVPEKLDLARQLFVRTVETPGGLKVQTIHAFCERLLHLFPFEANVGARFEAIDEETQRTLLEEAQLTVLHGDADDPDGQLARALALVAAETTAAGFEGLLRTIVGKGAALKLASKLQANGLRRELGCRLGLAAGEDRQTIAGAILEEGILEADLTTAIALLGASSVNDMKLAEKLRAAMAEDDSMERATAYANCFFNASDDKPSKTLGTKKIPEHVRNQLAHEQQRMIGLRDKLRAAVTLDRTCALYLLADEVHGQYNRFKAVRGYLDFNDLIERAATLLNRSDAGWILYKLDSGIDHILVDEAQDTSPVQWDILGQLSKEFFTGKGTSAHIRTFFAVGDEKQSIFSFQGAAPHEFGRQREDYCKLVEGADLRFADVELKVSFRSSQTILACVDRVFALASNRAGLTIDDTAAPVHHARKAKLPGFVELTPLVTREVAPDPDDWLLPVDALREEEPAAIMARQVADKIGELVSRDNRHAVHDQNGEPRQLTAGDIMILVRKRGPFFDAVIKALKERHIPVAGADRLNIMHHIAIMDLVAAGQVALLPSDDLTLACVLKSPLIGLDDDDLIQLAPHRSGSLFQALCASTETSHQAAAAQIGRWQAMALVQPPFEFYAALLGAGRGRHKLLSRLGTEANDAIDEFMRLALDSNAPGTATLAQFISRLTRTGLEIKRDMEGAGDTVRVMTVHAAKGLEAKVIFLPDTCSAPGGGRPPDIVDTHGDDLHSELFVWRKSKKDDPEAIGPLLDIKAQAEAEEHRRLLYVAMTRAEERLYIGGFHGAREPADHSWYRMIAAAFQGDHDDSGDGAELSGQDVSGQGVPILFGEEVHLNHLAASVAQARPDTEAPEWLFSAAPAERSPLPPLRPSTTLASADQTELVANQAIASGNTSPVFDGATMGRLVHDLLYRLPPLPPPQRPEAARRFLAARAGGLDAAMQDKLLADVISIIEEPALAAVFGPGARAEVAIAGSLSGPDGADIDISGRIDRLCITEQEVLLVDFKTGMARPASQTPPAYLRQMALYRAVLQKLFPGMPVRALLVWTGGPGVTDLPPPLLDQALVAAGVR
ncbi:MAG: double-strand break repair helicase AddA [Beijerinckiaceae bacterium]|jgi:ATP-dependent helicase/nuclease subunit A|nr:double-strand break repair helicase AddA [Beijerinckiaceae bacterium]